MLMKCNSSILWVKGQPQLRSENIFAAVAVLVCFFRQIFGYGMGCGCRHAGGPGGERLLYNGIGVLLRRQDGDAAVVIEHDGTVFILKEDFFGIPKEGG